MLLNDSQYVCICFSSRICCFSSRICMHLFQFHHPMTAVLRLGFASGPKTTKLMCLTGRASLVPPEPLALDRPLTTLWETVCILVFDLPKKLCMPAGQSSYTATLSKCLMLAFLRLTRGASLKLCIMIVFVKLYMLKPVSVTLTRIYRASGSKTANSADLHTSPDPIKLKHHVFVKCVYMIVCIMF